jgi:mannose-6-phosphate isomerase-like protein (cupin superfamily)
MLETSRPLFDFAAQSRDYQKILELIRTFADHEAFRSAAVEELVLDEDFHRRPVRPEDLSFIDFSQAARANTISRLPFLAAQRILLAINELNVARPPKDALKLSAATRFYETSNQVLGAQIRPFLEAFSFDFLDLPRNSDPTAEDIKQCVFSQVETDAVRWSRMLRNLATTKYVKDGLRYILIQTSCLLPSKRYALDGASGYGFFDMLPTEIRPSLSADPSLSDATNALAAACDITKREHSYWQFYLSTSLAACNFLYALGKRPDYQLQMLGAAFAAEADQLALGCLIGQGTHHLGLHTAKLNASNLSGDIDGLGRRVAHAMTIVGEYYGAAGLKKVYQGLEAARSLGDAAWRNLGEQIRWLSTVDRYQAIAHAIDSRIKAECPNIDQETFVEPREMCSTTHVHDDHRLVVIESGDMVFWGNLGMNLRLKPGEMILVPQGRLHGSSIESDECIYHQPIIPESWIEPLVNDAHRDLVSV